MSIAAAGSQPAALPLRQADAAAGGRPNNLKVSLRYLSSHTPYTLYVASARIQFPD
jgi:hypothetical protein